MSEQRRVFFTSIEGLDRADLPLCCEVWLDAAVRGPWASKELMRLAALFVRYIMNPAATPVSIRDIEAQYQITREEVNRGLRLLQAFLAINSFTIERDDIRVALNLSLLQRLRVLEAKQQLAALMPEVASTALQLAPAA